MPDAVVAYSNGAIAAVYTAGALRAKEVITTLWKRESASQKPKEAGGMTTIDLSAEEAYPLLSAGIVVTCEDSHKSAIISGDAKEIQKPVEHTRESHSDIGTRVLKVDKADHSHHMSESGSEYHAMIQPQLEDKSPLKPYFFNVTGNKIEEHLHDSYWQENLETPVFFRSAVAPIVEYFDTIAFPRSELIGR